MKMPDVWYNVPLPMRVALFLTVCTLGAAMVGTLFGHNGVGALMGLAFGVGVVVGDWLGA